MLRFFRAVLRRDPEIEGYDPGFSYYSIENSFGLLETKYDIRKLRKFMIIKKSYVVFGIVTDLDNITEQELVITTTITNNMLFNSIIDTVKVVRLKLKEWYYPTDINIDKGIRLIINHRNNSLLMNSDNIFKLLELDNNKWECIMNANVPEEDFITFYRIFNTEVNYGRKRRKIF